MLRAVVIREHQSCRVFRLCCELNEVESQPRMTKEDKSKHTCIISSSSFFMQFGRFGIEFSNLDFQKQRLKWPPFSFCTFPLFFDLCPYFFFLPSFLAQLTRSSI